MHPRVRSSKFYTKNTDSISFQAQTGRDRNANAEENRQKMFEELQNIYTEAVPGESSPDKRRKIQGL